MNISDFTNSMKASALLSGKASALGTAAQTAKAAASTVDPIEKAFSEANKRVQQQLDTTTAQLSSFGKLKSSFSEVQGAAKTLGAVSATATDAGVSKAVGDFVATFNAALTTTQSSQAQATSIKETTGARRAETDLRRVIGNDSAQNTSLKKMGITQQADGSLSVDATKFQAAMKADPGALRSTVAKLGQQSQAVATRELADTGNVGSTLKALTTQSSSLQSRQSEQQAALAALQQFASSQNAASGSGNASGLAKYNRIYNNTF